MKRIEGRIKRSGKEGEEEGRKKRREEGRKQEGRKE